MIAVDTNVLVRLLIEDDPEQFAAVRALFSSKTVWVAKTVLLESAWVLRTGYAYDDRETCEAFTLILGMPNVVVEDASSVVAALALVEHGLDFPDALHLTGQPANATFMTFDKAMLRKAKKAGIDRISLIQPALS